MFKSIKEKRERYELGVLSSLASSLLFLFLRYLIAPLIKFLWIGKIEGLENIPKSGPVIIASNHESYFDFICFWSVSPRKIQYLAAEKFYSSKFWRPIMVATGQIKVDRVNKDKKGVHERAHYILKNEGVLGIFPEGTRSRTGELGKAFTGVTRFALTAKVPIVPIGMVGTYHILAPHNKIPRLKRCHIKIGQPVFHEDHFNKEHTEDLLRRLTDDLMLLIAMLVNKEYKHHYLNSGEKKVIEGEVIEVKNKILFVVRL